MLVLLGQGVFCHLCTVLQPISAEKTTATTAACRRHGYDLKQDDLSNLELGEVQVGDLVRKSFTHGLAPLDGKGESEWEGAPLAPRIGGADIYLYIRM